MQLFHMKQWCWKPEQTRSSGKVVQFSNISRVSRRRLPATVVSSIVVQPYFINPVTALTPWGCVCFHYKGDWAEWWSGSRPADKTKPFTKNISQRPADGLYLDTWLQILMINDMKVLQDKLWTRVCGLELSEAATNVRRHNISTHWMVRNP